MWGIFWAMLTWLYLWSVGTWTLQWRDVVDLLPIAVSTLLSGMMLDHFEIRGWRLGMAVFVMALWLIPSADLLIRPGCAGVDSIEFYRTDDGTLDTRCAETADMTQEGLFALVGLAAVAGLVAILVRTRRARPSPGGDGAGPRTTRPDREPPPGSAGS